ncbi:HAMP domain-containing histidine kinase [Aliidiomarina halalkaliphila]|uniref:histidine kinase n=1 Tax=Aliidiomarina halalkaliphila TaxID=2593535 RepID=A0A552X5P3_9GAMM|nr:HAMP domain-containing sensor histidine kinase [Aliidiomarina halalkaliphila]TRW50347.1 HAMP domain-containing histidine kinase [Aliidiomarina halalkaliphila]
MLKTLGLLYGELANVAVQQPSPIGTHNARYRWSLAQRLNVIVTGIVALALLIFIGMTTLWLSDSERTQLAENTNAAAMRLAQQVAESDLSSEQLQRILNDLATHEFVQHAHIYVYIPNDNRFSYRASYHHSSASPLPSQEDYLVDEPVRTFGRDYFEVAMPVVGNRDLLGAVLVRSSLSHVQFQFQRHLWLSLGVFLVVMISVSLGLRFFIRGMESNIHKFTRAVASASQNNDESLQHVHYLPSEFSELRYQIRRLLEKYRHEQRYSEHASNQARTMRERMEQEIGERTEALLDVNRKLTKALEELHQYQRKRLTEDKLASLGELVAGIAHEMNTPLGTAITATSLLREQREILAERVQEQSLTTEQMQGYLQRTDDSIQVADRNLMRCADLIQHFQQLAMFNRNDTPREVDLAVCAQRTIERVQDALSIPEHVSIQLECAANQRAVVRPLVLEQILLELIENCIRHASIRDKDDQPLPLHIGIHITCDPNYLTVRVADDGRGIDPELSARIFDPFVTSSRSKGDKGLGLFQVYNWVTHLLHGEVQCDTELWFDGSDDEHGTSITLFIPVEPTP